MNKKAEDKADEVCELAMDALKRLGVRAAIISFDAGDGKAAGTRVVHLFYGGFGDQAIGALAISTTEKVLGELAEQQQSLSIREREAGGMDAREAISMMTEQAVNGKKLEHLAGFMAKVKLVKPL